LGYDVNCGTKQIQLPQTQVPKLRAALAGMHELDEFPFSRRLETDAESFCYNLLKTVSLSVDRRFATYPTFPPEIPDKYPRTVFTDSDGNNCTVALAPSVRKPSYIESLDTVFTVPNTFKLHRNLKAMASADPYIKKVSSGDLSPTVYKLSTGPEIFEYTCGKVFGDEVPSNRNTPVLFREKIYLNCDGEEVQATSKDISEVMTLDDIVQSNFFPLFNQENGYFNGKPHYYLPFSLPFFVFKNRHEGGAKVIGYNMDDEKMLRRYPESLFCMNISYAGDRQDGKQDGDVLFRQVSPMLFYSSDNTYSTVYRSMYNNQQLSNLRRLVRSLPTFFKEEKPKGKNCQAQKSKYYNYDFRRAIDEMCHRAKNLRPVEAKQ